MSDMEGLEGMNVGNIKLPTGSSSFSAPMVTATMRSSSASRATLQLASERLTLPLFARTRRDAPEILVVQRADVDGSS